MNLIFSNPGEIDVRLITTLGVNVKSSSSPIGYFGTGLKYAIAVCLRLGCEVTILSGLDKHRFAVERDTIRGKEFSFITLHTTRQGIHAEPLQRLGFTTELGKNWLPWMAYREFYCNMIDEGGSLRLLQATPEAASGTTQVIISGAEMLKAHHERSSWLLTTPPTWTLPSVEILNKPSNAIFYKGIKVHENEKEFLFTYNIVAELRLSEDRTADSWRSMAIIRHAIAQESAPESLLRSILTAREGRHEHDFDWGYVSPDENFSQVVEALWSEHNAFLSKSAIAVCRSKFKRDPLESIPLSAIQTRMLAKAKAFLEAFGYAITQRIIVVETLGDHWTLGQAKDGEIILARSVFDKGTKYLTSTLLEEHLHITHGFTDCSRELQDWLFDKVISLAEEARGEPL